MKQRTLLLSLLALFVVVSVLTVRAQPGRADANILLSPGYQIEAYVTGLTFPTSVAWDAEGRMYVTEAGYAYGPKEVGPGRVLQVEPGKSTVVVDDLNSPATDVKISEDGMFVAHRGYLTAFRGGVRQDLITGLPSGDHFTTEIAFDNDGWVYLGNGTVTNAGVVGEDNFRYGWVNNFPQWHDIPGHDITLSGQNLVSLDMRTPAPKDTVSTGGFVPFGETTTQGQVVQGKPQAGGVILRVRPDGSDLQVYAWGLRNPFGLRFHPDGRLVAIDQGYDDRGLRPVANAPDPVYVIKEDGWYGWPDFAAGLPLSDPSLKSDKPGWPPAPLMLQHPPLETPVASLPAHTAAMKFDFAPASFDSADLMYIAAFGAGDPVTGTVSQDTGSRILTLNLQNGQVQAFARNKTGKPAGRSVNAFNHPVDVKFGPDNCLYVVDFGVFEMNGQVPNAVPNTGVIWKICKQRFSYTRGGLADAGLTRGENPWNPDYGPLRTQLEEKIATFSAEWGVYFKDLTSGKTFGIREEMPVAAASTVKVPVVLYAATLVAEGKLSWNERLTYESWRDWRGGAGSLQFTAKDGDTFSIRELAEKSIRESDNVAWKMLEKRLGLENIAGFMRSVGGLHVYPNWQNISTAKDMVTYMQAVLDFTEKHPEIGDDILHWLSTTIWNTGLNRYIDEVEVGHKEGDITGISDDVGIVWANHPYLIAIMSKGQDDVELGFERIGQLSRIVFDYQVGQEAAQGKTPTE